MTVRGSLLQESSDSLSRVSLWIQTSLSEKIGAFVSFLSSASNVKTLALMMRHERKDLMLTTTKKNQELLSLKKCGREVKISNISSEDNRDY